MAYDISIGANFNDTGPNTYQLFLYVRRDQTDVANNRSNYAWELQCRFISGTNLRYNLDPIRFGVNIHTDTFYPINNLDMRGVSVRSLGTGTSNWFGHDSSGNLSFGVRCWVGYVDLFGSADTGWVPFYTDRIDQFPGAPGTPSLTRTSPNSIGVSFAPANANGGTILEYQYQYSTSPSFSSATTVSTGTGRTGTASSLAYGTTYYFRARARTGRGWGPWSGTASASTAGVPSAPATPTASSITPNGVTIGWTAPANNGAPITGYDLQRATVSSFSDATTIYSGTATSYADTGLNPATTYYYRVRAKNAAGAGSWSATRTVTTAADFPGAPGTPTTSAVTFESMTAAWTAAAANGAEITQYQLQIATNSGFTAGLQTFNNGTALNRAISGLSPATTYYLRVRAQNSVGFGPWSGTRTQATPATIPTAPLSPSVEAASTVSAIMSWAPPSSNGGAALSGYTLQYSTSSTFASEVTTIELGVVTTRTVTGLNPGTTYYFRVAAKNSAGTGPWSSTVSTTTPAAVAPGMTVTAAPNGRSATVALAPPGGSTAVTKYTVERRVGSSGTVTSTDTTSTSLAVSGLTPGTQYQWRASAWFGTYQSPWTSWTALTQPNPSTSPGQYFDGSTTDTPDINFQWVGTANNSISRGVARGVLGWVGSAGSSGASVLSVYQVTGGYSGGFAVRLMVSGDATTSGVYVGMATGSGAEIQPLTDYVGSIYVRPSRAQRLRLGMLFYNSAGTAIGGTVYGPAQLVTDTDVWTRLTMTAKSPASAVKVVLRVYDVTGTGWSTWKGGEYLDADAMMVTLSSLFDYFDGSSASTSEFSYSWLGTPNNSVSMRTVLEQGEVDPLLDPDCPPAPIPPRPPVIDDPCIDDIGIWRRYWSVVPAAEVSAWLAVLPTILLSTGSLAERQVRIRIYENPEGLTPSVFDTSSWVSEQIISYIPPDTDLILDAVTERVFATVGNAAPIAADKLLFGTGGLPPTWPVLSCGIGYLISYDVPIEAPSGNLTIGVQLTRRT